MPSPDLSVSELAQMTGLVIGPAWNCTIAANGNARIVLWCAPGWRAEDLLEAAPSGLPAGSAVRVECRTGDAVLDAEWPISLDLHWLREITPGFPLGVRPVRAQPERAASSTVRLQGDFASVLWRDASGRTRVQVTRCSEGSCAVKNEAGANPHSHGPATMDEVLRALTGSTSVEWLRGVFEDSCSLRWNELARRMGARADQFDDLATYFRTLKTTEEDAIWRAATSAGSLAELQPFADLLASGQTDAFPELLREELEREGISFWRGAAGEWLSELAGGAVGDLSTPEVAARLAEPARKLLSLLIRDDLASLLVRLRAEADREWAMLSPWYRRRIEESCGALSEDAGSGNVLEQVSLWMKKLRERLLSHAAQAARESARAALSACLVSRRDGDRALAEFAFEHTAQGDAAIQRVLAGDWRPCFESMGGAKLIGGSICHTLGRRFGVEVLLPFLPKTSWKLERQSLAEAEIQQNGGAQLTVLRNDEAGLRQGAALLLSAVCTSRSEAPADDMIHIVHEDRRSLNGDECDAFWLRLIAAYGLPSPQLPVAACRTAHEAPPEATLRLEIPWNLAEAWCHAPVKRDARYLDKFLQLSQAMQEMTRHWLPALCLSSPARFDSPNTVLPLLVYAASHPYVDRRQVEFGYGAMSPNMVERAAASATQRLPETLAPLYERLRASGRRRTAELYSPERARLIVSAVQRKPRAFATLLAGDTFLLEYCFQIAGMCRDLRGLAGRNPAQALRKLSQFSDEIVKGCRKGMKQFYADEAYRGLGSIYLLEATRVLAGGSVQRGLRASLTVTTGSGIRQYEAAA